MAESMVIGMMMLSATNYMSWKPRMEDILYAKDMYDLLGNEAREGAWYQLVEMQEQGEILFYMGPVVEARDAGTLGGGAGHSDESVVGRLVTRTRLECQ
ncbi:hypothetical protein CJ030_MR4G023330 [Morella rubra]|uniref:Uncharacterized protein n=1 Tax=Morella rubra TaxID=262757 RepID=A0A6A1VRY1_9ROSI|nr:hypothetical protein CJ030_MR4G023330 [Morella rubra]